MRSPKTLAYAVNTYSQAMRVSQCSQGNRRRCPNKLVISALCDRRYAMLENSALVAYYTTCLQGVGLDIYLQLHDDLEYV